MADLLIDTQTTDASGQALFANLPAGTYYFLEKTSPSGYTKDLVKHYFTLTAGQTDSQTTTNVPVETGSLKVIKHVTGNTGQVLPLAKFTLTKGAYTLVAVSDDTDDDGQVTFNNLKTETLIEDVYTVQEQHAPDGYELNLNTYDKAITPSAIEEQLVPNDPTSEGQMTLELDDSFYSGLKLQGEYDLYWHTGPQT